MKFFDNLKSRLHDMKYMKKYGYIIRKKGDIVYTEGLPKAKGIYEFQIKLVPSLSISTAEMIIRYYVRKTVRGNKNFYDAFIEDADENGNYTWLKLLYSGKRDESFIYRIILPDEYNRAPWDNNCNPVYKAQWKLDDNLENVLISYELEENFVETTCLE